MTQVHKKVLIVVMTSGGEEREGERRGRGRGEGGGEEKEGERRGRGRGRRERMGDREEVGERMRRTCVSRYRGGRERAVRTSKTAQMLSQRALLRDHCPRLSSVCVCPSSKPSKH